MAAAAGGITTVIEHTLTYPPVTSAELYREKREMAKGKVVVDFGLWGALTAPSLPEMEQQWNEGAGGFKAFMPFSEPAYPHVTDAEFLEGMRQAAALDALVLVHAENDSLLQANLTRLAEEGRRTVVVLIGLVGVFAIAGLIEGFVTGQPWPTWMRVAIGAAATATFLAYAWLRGRAATARGLTGALGEQADAGWARPLHMSP
jgi:hypothetical protein